VFAASSAPASAAAAASVVGGDAHPQTCVRHDRDSRGQRWYRHLNVTSVATGVVHVQPVTHEFRGLTASSARTRTRVALVFFATGAPGARHAAAGTGQGQKPEEEQKQVAGEDQNYQVPRVQGTAERAQVTKSEREFGRDFV